MEDFLRPPGMVVGGALGAIEVGCLTVTAGSILTEVVGCFSTTSVDDCFTAIEGTGCEKSVGFGVVVEPSPRRAVFSLDRQLPLWSVNKTVFKILSCSLFG